MKVDQHVHSKISHDGISTMSEHIEYAKEHNISEITFTEHFDDYTGIITNNGSTKAIHNATKN